MILRLCLPVYGRDGKILLPDDWLRTCTIITGEPNEFVRQIHTRMPLILPEEQHVAWLSGEAGKEILTPFPADQMKAWPISPRVNKPGNNDSEIIAQIGG
jgi:putative SOS response-associated peptidase YedK